MKRNVGILDSMIRLTLGFFCFGQSIRHRHNLMMLFSACEIASGLTRFCPIYKFLNLSTYEHRITRLLR